MVKLETEKLTAIGKIINDLGLNLKHVIEKSGINRNRLVALRLEKRSNLTFAEARALAPVLKLSLDELANEIDKFEQEEEMIKTKQ